MIYIVYISFSFSDGRLQHDDPKYGLINFSSDSKKFLSVSEFFNGSSKLQHEFPISPQQLLIVPVILLFFTRSLASHKHPQPCCSCIMMAFSGQFLKYAPHSIHTSCLVIPYFPSSLGSSKPNGHTSAHFPQPTQAAGLIKTLRFSIWAFSFVGMVLFIIVIISLI